MNIAIFGGGVAGLATAHELIRQGHVVSLYEADSSLGGLAKTIEPEPGVVQERSWRGINTKLYKNLLEIFGDIGVSPLSEKFRFLHLKDSGGISAYPTPLDLYKLSKCLLPALLDPLNPKYFEMNFKNTVGELSEGGNHRVYRMLCPGLGLKEEDVSVGHVANLVSTLSVHEIYKGHHWAVTTKPTSEAWIEPWAEYLRELGVNIHCGAELQEVVASKKEIKYCVLNQFPVKADHYVFAINPYRLYPLVQHIDCPQVDNLEIITQTEPTTEVAFQIGFSKKFQFPEETNVLTFPNSEFNITICDQSLFWDKNLGETKSLWSCVACIVPNKYISEKEFEQRVKEQIYCNFALQEAVECKDIGRYESWFRIWPTWVFSETEGLHNPNPHWVNSVETYYNRVEQKTSLHNMHFAGAHTKTDTIIFSMEAACESGRRVARNIDAKCTVKETDRHRFKNLFVFLVLIFLLVMSQPVMKMARRLLI